MRSHIPNFVSPLTPKMGSDILQWKASFFFISDTCCSMSTWSFKGRIPSREPSLDKEKDLYFLSHHERLRPHIAQGGEKKGNPGE